MRIAYISEGLVPPFDEGIKKASWHLLRELQQQHEVLALTNRGSGMPDAGVHLVHTNRLLLSLDLRRRVRRFRPDRVVYLPTACATLVSFIRAKALSLYAGGIPTAMIALQPRQYGALARRVIPFLLTGPIWTQGDATAQTLAPLGCDVRTLPPAVDATVFVPADAAQKAALREKYSIPAEAFVLLHVGHIHPNRNVPVLMDLQRRGGVQVVLVGSTRFGADSALVQELRSAGVIVIDRYLQHVEEVYQMSDCYLFPVQSLTGSIEVPLSVLEAMACNLPIISTPFGELPKLFPEGAGVHYYHDMDGLLAAIETIRLNTGANTRSRVEPYTWAAVARKVVGETEGRA